jgi:hypothetical protein
MKDMIEGIPKNWLGIVETKVGPLSEADRALVERVAENIATRWGVKAYEEDPDSPDVKFKTLYATHKDRAQAWIVAIVEMVRALGDGEPERFQA